MSTEISTIFELSSAYSNWNRFYFKHTYVNRCRYVTQDWGTFNRYIMRLYICREHWRHKSMRYHEMYPVMLPVNHTSGCWTDGFTFNSDYFLLLGIL